MKRISVAVLLLALLGVAGCGEDEPAAPAVEVPPWATVAPEQIAEAKKHGMPVAFENDLGMRFVLIPAGTFVMGSPEEEKGRDDDETQHEVTITKPYYMQITEVTYGQYRQFRPDYLSHLGPGFDDEPVPFLTHGEAMTFAGWSSEREDGRGYRLPSEAEWEYACRAGTTTRFWLGDGEHDAEAVRRIVESDYTRPGPVAGKPANPFGLHDMHGNVSEWCADSWHDSYVGAPADGSAWVDGSSSAHVVRGGNWFSLFTDARSASRDWRDPARGSNTIGIRLVSPLPEAKE